MLKWDWQFVQKYIMQNTAYPSHRRCPITSWIPNQIKAVLKAMQVLAQSLNNDPQWIKTSGKKAITGK